MPFAQQRHMLRHRVLSVPKRLRWFMQGGGALPNWRRAASCRRSRKARISKASVQPWQATQCCEGVRWPWSSGSALGAALAIRPYTGCREPLSGRTERHQRGVLVRDGRLVESNGVDFILAPERRALNGLGARPVESEKAMLLSVLTLPTISTRWSGPGIHQLGKHLGLQRLQDFVAVRVALSDDLIELVPLQHAHPVQRWVEVHVGGCLRLAVA